ncbi:MAG: class A beta-lactamase-related serine hydrolase [Acidobacteriota bacterium]|nr:class A beta-lactamase-related serine hydrolase [Acidobacteriota bacterium]
MKSTVFLAAGALGVLSFVPAPPRPSLEARIAAIAASFPGEMGVAVRDLSDGRETVVGGDRRFPTASLIKLAVMVETYHRMAEGTLARDKTIEVAEADRAGDESVPLNMLHAGIRVTIPDLLNLMIAYSDNTATNLLVREVGAAAVDRRMESYGLKDTKIFRPTFRDGHADVFPELEREFGLGMITPREAARLMGLIADGKVVSRAACDEMLAILGNQFDRQMIPRSLPFEREKIFVANKTGWDEEKLPDASGLKGEIRTDAAYVKGPKSRYTIAICTRRGKDKRPGSDNAALVIGAKISRLVYDEMESPAASR